MKLWFHILSVKLSFIFSYFGLMIFFLNGLLLSGPIRKRIQYFLVVNIWIGRTAPWISLLRNKTIRISRSTGMCIIHIGDLWIEKIRRPETKRNVYLFYLVIQLNQWVVIVADSNNHFIRHAYFLFSNGFTSFINGNFLM